MTMRELVTKCRSYRRFQESRPIGREVLTELVGTVRLMPSAYNLQPCRYILSCETEKNGLIFPCLSWAGNLKDWPGPAEGERPAAYIVIVADTELAKTVPWDHSIASVIIALAAAEKGVAACIIDSINRERLRTALQIPERYAILLVVALGYAAEKIVIDEMKGGGYKYWRDAQGAHHVPKRSLGELILDI
jgi:nitroreductase